MQYEPIKLQIDRFISGSILLKMFFFKLLDIYLLRTWHVHKVLKKILKDQKDSFVVMDAGAGFGQYSWFLLRKWKNIKVSAVDISEKHIEKAKDFFDKANYKNIDLHTASLTEYYEKEKFDLIISVDVMEHIMDDLKVFENFHASLKEGGILLVSTPSDQGGSGVHDHHEDESFIDEHVRDGYSILEISEKLKTVGFDEVECKYTYGKPGKISWLMQMMVPISLLNKSKFFVLFLIIYLPLIILPCLLLNLADLHIKHRSGTGLIVTARKNHV